MGTSAQTPPYGTVSDRFSVIRVRIETAGTPLVVRNPGPMRRGRQRLDKPEVTGSSPVRPIADPHVDWPRNFGELGPKSAQWSEKPAPPCVGLRGVAWQATDAQTDALSLECIGVDPLSGDRTEMTCTTREGLAGR